MHTSSTREGIGDVDDVLGERYGESEALVPSPSWPVLRHGSMLTKICAFPMPAPRCREKLLNARVAAMKREAQVAIKGKQKKRALMALKKKKM